MIIFIINVINIINQAIVAGTKPVITLYASKLGASPFEIGLLVSVFAFLPALLAVHMGKWIDRYGVRVFVSCGGVAIVLSIILPMLVPSMIAFIGSQTIMGLAFTSQVVALQKRVGSGKESMDNRIAMFSLYASFGAMLGPLLSTYMYEKAGFFFSYAANGLLGVAAIVSMRLVKRDAWNAAQEGTTTAVQAKAGENVWRMLRHRELRNAVLTSGLAISGKEIFSAYFPLLGEQMQMSPTTIGIILSIMGSAAMISRFSQQYLVGWFGRGQVLTWSLYISGIIYILTPAVPVVVVLTLLIAILGASLGLGQPLSLTYAIQVSPVDRRGEVLGMRITCNRVSQMLIPALFGGIGGAAGLSVIFVASGVMLVLGGFYSRPKAVSAQKSEAM